MRILLTIIRSLITIVFALILTLNLLLMASMKLFDQDLPSAGGYTAIYVTGSEMSPDIVKNDLLILHRKTEYDLAQVVAFKRDGNNYLRRIVGKNSEGFITQGDGMKETDEQLLKRSAIIGEAVINFPAMGPVFKFLLTPVCSAVIVIAWIILVLVPALLLHRADSIEADAGSDVGSEPLFL